MSDEKFNNIAIKLGVGFFVLVISLSIFGGGPIIKSLRVKYVSPYKVNVYPLENASSDLLLAERVLRVFSGEDDPGEDWPNYHVLDNKTGEKVSDFWFDPNNAFNYNKMDYKGNFGDLLLFRKTNETEDNNKKFVVHDAKTGEQVQTSEDILKAFEEKNHSLEGKVHKFNYDDRKRAFLVEQKDGMNYHFDIEGNVYAKIPEYQKSFQPIQIGYKDMLRSRSSEYSIDYGIIFKQTSGTKFYQLYRPPSNNKAPPFSELKFLLGNAVHITQQYFYIAHISELGDNGKMILSVYDITNDKILWSIKQEEIMTADEGFSELGEKPLSMLLSKNEDFVYLSTSDFLYKIDQQTGAILWTHEH